MRDFVLRYLLKQEPESRFPERLTIRDYFGYALAVWIIVAVFVGSLVMFAWICQIIGGDPGP